jgi:hypothetical protein
MEYTDKEICSVLPEIAKISRDLYDNDADFKKEVETFTKCITDKVDELISENGTIKANALILACFGTIKSVCKNVTPIEE